MIGRYTGICPAAAFSPNPTFIDGRIYEVNHPELAMVGQSIVTIGIPSSGNEKPIYGPVVTISSLYTTYNASRVLGRGFY